MSTPGTLGRTRAPSRSVRIVGLVGLLILAQGAVGWWVYTTIETSLKASLAEDLRTILESEVAALSLWLDNHESAVSAAAEEPRVRDSVRRLLELAHRPGVAPDEIMASAPLAELSEHLRLLLRANDYERFGVIDPQGLLIASDLSAPVAYGEAEGPLQFVGQVLAGETVVSRPFLMVPHEAPVAGESTERPNMFAASPILDSNGNVIAGLGFGIRPEEFAAILRVARSGESGETYAFDSKGLLISESRFDDDLRAIGLLPDGDSESMLRIEIRNPGGDMLEGFRPTQPRNEQPLTRMATAAVAGESGLDVEGYRDYRGVPVIGAWLWLPKYGFGVTTEIDQAEAYETLNRLRAAFWALMGLLFISAVAILLAYTVIGGLRRSMRRAQKLGQYTLEKKLGEGGMGAVYRARHALLRRPTAVKLLRPEVTSGENIARFEREVQLTSQLTHPNTIAIYDYGRTPDGIFYYAMEYLLGITLDRLSEQDGPQPEARVIHILAQASSSLAEAHNSGLIHRDIKPSNIMLCERGGIFDVVKVLDFGLVKEVDQSKDAGITGVNTITGTPLYLSPEAIRASDLDGRSDLYSLGAVGYYLLTGEHVFTGEAAIEVFSHHLTTEPEPPSARLGREISKDLEEIILSCLQKDRDSRPKDANALRLALEDCRDSGGWGREEARAWWEEHPDLAAQALEGKGETPDSARLSESFAVALEDRVRS